MFVNKHSFFLLAKRMLSGLLKHEHGWRVILKVAHFVGLISLPNFYKAGWKNTAHGNYSLCVTVFTVINTISLVCNVLIYSIRDSGEFCQRSFECMLILCVTLISFHARLNLEKLLGMVDFFETVCIYHRNESVVIAYKRREKYWMLLMFILIVFTCTGIPTYNNMWQASACVQVLFSK